MSYHELSRRELQSRCREYGLPANKANAVMASSLTSFLGDPRTNVLARAPQALPAAKKSIRARVLPKTERLETSLASLILEATESRAKILKSKPRELHITAGRKLPVTADLAAFIVSSPTKHTESVPQPKTGPLLPRTKQSDATHSTGVSADPTRNLSVLHEEIPVQGSGTVVKKLSTPEAQLVPVLDAAVLGTCDEGPIEFEPIASPLAIIRRDQGCQNKTCYEKHVQASQLGPLFRISANVEKLRGQVTMMLRKFDEWKDIDKLSTATETH